MIDKNTRETLAEANREWLELIRESRDPEGSSNPYERIEKLRQQLEALERKVSRRR